MVIMPLVAGQRYETRDNLICEIVFVDNVNEMLGVKWINTGLGSIKWPFEEFRRRNWKLLDTQIEKPLEKGQIWRNKASGQLVTLLERNADAEFHPDSGFRLDHGGWTAPDFRLYYTLVSEASDAPAKRPTLADLLDPDFHPPRSPCGASRTGNPIDCGGCDEHGYPAAKEAPADNVPFDLYWVREMTGPKCPNVDCYTPFKNVAQRYSPLIGKTGIVYGTVLEVSCEPCHLLDEEEWAQRTGNAGQNGALRDAKIPERIDRRLTHAAGMHDDDLIG